jgi:EpsI family protein
MNALNLKYLLIGLALFVAAVGGVALKPTKHIADQGPKIDLETMIPPQFADWKVDENVVPLLVDPQSLEVLNRIYNQTLARTYINQKGERIMLSIAYGGDQSDSMQVHKPEVCYPAQGFEILKKTDGSLDSGFGDIPVRRLVAQQGMRIEPITYWIRIGDAVAVNSSRWKLEQLRYGLTGKVPDGLVFRVSSITPNETTAFQRQSEFVRDLLSYLDKNTRSSLIGKPIIQAKGSNE